MPIVTGLCSDLADETCHVNFEGVIHFYVEKKTAKFNMQRAKRRERFQGEIQEEWINTVRSLVSFSTFQTRRKVALLIVGAQDSSGMQSSKQ